MNNTFVVDLLERKREDLRKRSDFVSWDAVDQLAKTTYLLGIFQITLIILFATVGGSQILYPATAPGTGTQGYNMFIGVEIMMFVGFGYLMTFLKWYGLGAVGFTVMITAVGLQWAVYTESFWHQLYFNTPANQWHLVDFNIYSLLNALYAVSAVLISFGAVIGKVSPFQLLIMTIIELFCHSFNDQVLMTGVMNLVDLGGTYTDHMFGAYFGLTVAWMMGPPKSEPEMGNTPDIFSLIGTVFLWIYWPSFVAGAAVADSEQQQYAIVNTILSLSASTVATFFLSTLLSKNGRMRPVDIQNATLAGGVSIGCTANLSMPVLNAVLIGITAGLVSTFGYNALQGYLEHKWKLHDTCGIHNLHAMPSVIGALASVILAGYKYAHNEDPDVYGNNLNSQWWRQLLAIFLCIAFAVTAGMLVGKLLKAVESNEEGSISDFHDNNYWEVAEDYGSSLYSELALLLGEGKLKEEAQDLLVESTFHFGRRATSVQSKQNSLDSTLSPLLT